MTTLDKSSVLKEEQHNYNYVKIAGLRVFKDGLEAAVNLAEQHLNSGEKHYYFTLNGFGISLIKKHANLEEAVKNAEVIFPDGVLIKFGAWLKNENLSRVTGRDLADRICALASEKKYTVYFLGGDEESVENAAENYAQKNTEIIAGFHSPSKDFFRESKKNETDEVIEKINNSCPDIVLIAGSEKYATHWIYKHRDKINAELVFNVGQAFDIKSGKKKSAPGWMRKIGLEWGYRYLTEKKFRERKYFLSSSMILLRDVFLFEQIRIGENGQPFRIYKLRTLKEDNANSSNKINIEQGKLYLEKKEGRTLLGKILRATGFDELPQLYNILATKDMTFVGPRPLIPEEHKRLPEHLKNLKEFFKPGIFNPYYTSLIELYDNNKRACREMRFLELKKKLIERKESTFAIDFALLLTSASVFLTYNFICKPFLKLANLYARVKKENER